MGLFIWAINFIISKLLSIFFRIPTNSVIIYIGQILRVGPNPLISFNRIFFYQIAIHKIFIEIVDQIINYKITDKSA